MWKAVAGIVVATVALTALPAHATTSTVVWQTRRGKVIEVVSDDGQTAKYYLKNRTRRDIEGRMTFDQANAQGTVYGSGTYEVSLNPRQRILMHTEYDGGRAINWAGRLRLVRGT